MIGMRRVGLSRVAMRLMLAAGVAALVAGCSDASRFSADPFSDPFENSRPRPVAARSQRTVDRAPTGSIPATPIQAQPLAPPTSNVSVAPVAPRPVQAAQAAPAPSAGSYNHWSAEGGTPITVAEGDNAAVLANRYGVPAEVLLKVNGYSNAAQVHPGARLVIPVYRASGAKSQVAAETHALEAKRLAKEDADEGEQPGKSSHKAAVAVKSEKAKLAAKSDDDEDEAKQANKGKAKSGKAKLAADDEEHGVKKSAKAKTAADDEDDGAKSTVKKSAKAKAAADDEEEDGAKSAVKKSAKAKVAADDEDEGAKSAVKKSAKAKAAADDEEDGAKSAVKKAKKSKLASDDEEDAAKSAVKKAKKSKLASGDEEDEGQSAAKAAAKAKIAKRDREEAEKAQAAAKAKTRTAQVEPERQIVPPTPKKQSAKGSTEPRSQTQVAVNEEAPERAPAPEPHKTEKSAPAPAAATPAPTQEERASDGAHPEFRWPARGRIIQGFASGGNDGINIAVPEGTQVKAAEAGVVAYAGNELKGYGNLVLIRHPNGFVTAYAHNGDLAVKRGDQVTRGQMIAKSGQSGNVATPQLHFELRKGSTPVDPTNYLAGL
jgi:murein DD-endopeptidase MepM/ murein hydrolase activator NlpD